MHTITVDDVKEIVVNGLPEWIETHPELHHRLAMISAYANEKPKDKTVPYGRVTYEEFLDWCNEDTWAEWVDGEVIMLSPASPEHQNLSDFLVSVLRPYIETHGLGRVISAPLAMRLEHGREPDLLFVATEHLDRLYTGGLQGPADVVVEIISPESGGRDRGVKYLEYEAGGVLEYWLIDPLRKRAEFYRLDDEGLYDTVFAGREGVFHSQVIAGFWLRVEWLWQEPLPLPIKVLGEIAGIDPALIETFVQALAGETGN